MRPDRQLRALARRQHGVFLLEQIVALGYARSTIARRLERGVWEEVVPRGYRAAAARPADWRQMTMATTLVTAGRATGRTAGALFELLVPPAVPKSSRRDGPDCPSPQRSVPPRSSRRAIARRSTGSRARARSER